MKPAAYYNEIDPFAAQWLRNLIAGGHIAAGEVDERSIEDVRPDDLKGFTQCHFFAGIGVWSHALRLAGWPDDKPVWTGSCPCQPFSSAGKGDGFADERHLWPTFFHLISECRPQYAFGEQVAAGNANSWFDLVQSDLEGVGYAFGITPFTSASIGAPHIRERAYWVAESVSQQHQKLLPRLVEGDSAQGSRATTQSTGFCRVGSMDKTKSFRREPGRDRSNTEHDGQQPYAAGQVCGVAYANMQHQPTAGNTPGATKPFGRSEIIRMANLDSWLDSKNRLQCLGEHGQFEENGSSVWRELEGLGDQCDVASPIALEVNGFWRDADWLFCRDGKWRPVEPGTFPLVDGAAARLGRVESGVARVASSNRVGRIKGYGNAINAYAAAAFIEAAMQAVL
ncbi:DNA cytosine methyltransferase [Citrobacter sp. BDA59-3]|uniref:DNA cytosine methyltransferase n=1 Tax=Citrobacter sp. BDA59-3 TaxID=2781952 RepID=UPI00187E9E37|nr:DNA cytosine methyltransferase [Citrobacter sp. BDA59-3]QOV67782.1 DNA cytosine methyltransferase [Citrobacter sp. BDA59-3]